MNRTEWPGSEAEGMRRERRKQLGRTTITAVRLSIAVCACSVACTVERGDVRTPSGEPPEADTTRIRANLAAISRAYQTGELSTLDSIYHDSVTVFEGGRIDRGWASYRDRHLARELEAMSDRRLDFADVRVNLVGGTAWVTCRYRLSGTRDGKAVASTGVQTFVFRRSRGRWQVVHVHSSAASRGGGTSGPQTGT